MKFEKLSIKNKQHPPFWKGTANKNEEKKETLNNISTNNEVTAAV